MEEQQVGWIAAIIIGGIAGWLAEQFMKSQMGLVMNIVLGIIGAAVANWLFGFLGITFGGWIDGAEIHGVYPRRQASATDDKVNTTSFAIHGVCGQRAHPPTPLRP
jgi:uncharacterized membrane protein YeaQ/YmgE (transglycosylase-associated protein family)